MRYRVRVKQLLDGDIQALCLAGPFGPVEVRAHSREEALAKMQRELHYQLEWCPCSGIAEELIELDVRE